MIPNETLKAALVWDKVIMATVSLLFIVACVFGNTILDDIKTLKIARAYADVEMATVKTTQQAQYKEIISRLDDMREWIRKTK